MATCCSAAGHCCGGICGIDGICTGAGGMICGWA